MPSVLLLVIVASLPSNPESCAALTAANPLFSLCTLHSRQAQAAAVLLSALRHFLGSCVRFGPSYSSYYRCFQFYTQCRTRRGGDALPCLIFSQIVSAPSCLPGFICPFLPVDMQINSSRHIWCWAPYSTLYYTSHFSPLEPALTSPSSSSGEPTMLFSVMDARIRLLPTASRHSGGLDLTVLGRKITTKRKTETVQLWGDWVQGIPITASADVTVTPSELRGHPGRPWASIQPFRLWSLLVYKTGDL